jgi:hypothetical protein
MRQGTDPATDLRDLGMFSVLQLVFLTTAGKLRKTKQVFQYLNEHEEAHKREGGNDVMCVCLCVCVYVCVCVCVCACVCVCVGIYVYISMYMCTYVDVCMP